MHKKWFDKPEQPPPLWWDQGYSRHGRPKFQASSVASPLGGEGNAQYSRCLQQETVSISDLLTIKFHKPQSQTAQHNHALGGRFSDKQQLNYFLASKRALT
jgi:hypothetical protein